MDTETVQATPQPAPTAQPSGEKKSGAANSTVSSFARSLLQKETAKAQQQATAEKAPEQVETPATETAPAVSSEETQVPPAEAETTTEATTEQVETEVEVQADEALSHETKLEPKLQEKINKRIGREVAKRKQLEAQVQQLQAQVTAVVPPKEETKTVTVPTNMPLADVPDQAGLAEVQRVARENQRVAEELLDRDDIAQGVKLGDQTYTKADLKAIVRQSRIVLEDQVPARQQFLTAQEQGRKQAQEQFPYLKDRTSPQYLEHQAALRANPWLLAQPNADWIAAVQLEGVRALAAKAEAAKKLPAKIIPKPKPAGDQLVTTDASAPRVPVGSLQQQAKVAASKVLEGKRGVNAKDYASFLRQQEQIKLSR